MMCYYIIPIKSDEDLSLKSTLTDWCDRTNYHLPFQEVGKLLTYQ